MLTLARNRFSSVCIYIYIYSLSPVLSYRFHNAVQYLFYNLLQYNYMNRFEKQRAQVSKLVETAKVLSC